MSDFFSNNSDDAAPAEPAGSRPNLLDPAQSLLDLLSRHGRLEKKEIFRLLDCEEPGEKDVVSSTLASLRQKNKIALSNKHYQLNTIEKSTILRVLERQPLSTDDLYAALEEYGTPDYVQIKKMLSDLKKEGSIQFDKRKWSLTPDIEAKTVLSLIEQKEGGATFEYLSKKLAHADSAKKKKLARVLNKLEKANCLRFHHDRYFCVPGLSARGITDYLEEMEGAFIEDLYAYFDKDFEDRSELDEMLQKLAADGDVILDRGLYRSARPMVLEGVYAPAMGEAKVKFEGDKAPCPAMSIRRSPFLLLPGDKIQVQPLERVYPGYIPRCDVVGVVQETKKRITMQLEKAPKGPGLIGVAEDSGRFDTHLGDTSTVFRVECNDIGADIMDVVEAKPVSRRDGLVYVEVVKCLNALSSISGQEELVKINRQVPQKFPDQVLREAQRFPLELSEQDKENRTDLTACPFVTMDGADAKDFDDAVFVEKTAKGAFRLHVAIADVSHYVRAGSPLDREALLRGNSWYFPTSVEPMLPHELCDHLCSLVPGEERLAVHVAMDFSTTGTIRKSAFDLAVIRSHARLTYDQAKKLVLDQDAEELDAFSQSNANAEAVLGMLQDALELYHLLAKKREKRGALSFDLPEPEAEFDEAGHVTGFCNAERHDMHRLIEEFMIAANEAVAVFLGRSGYPVVYRVHPAPSLDKLTLFKNMLVACGFLPKKNNFTAKMLPELLQSFKGRRGEAIFNRLCVRSMAQARYSPENIGHYGLASSAYCHFTSPIRRYADLLVHRALKLALGCGTDPVPAGKALTRVCDIINNQERAAQECEREMAKRIACLWMLRQPKDRDWEATVSSVQPYGAFVELDEAPVEGLVHVSTLGHGIWFDYDPARECLKSPISRSSYHLGTKMTVNLVSVDPVSLYIDFKEKQAEAYEGAPRRHQGQPGGRRPSGRGSGRGRGREKASYPGKRKRRH